MTLNSTDYKPCINEFTLPGELSHDGCGEVCIAYVANCHGLPSVTPQIVSTKIWGDQTPGFTTLPQLCKALDMLDMTTSLAGPVLPQAFYSGDIVPCYCSPEGTILPKGHPLAEGHWVIVLDSDEFDVIIANPAGGTVQLITQEGLLSSFQGGNIISTGSLLPMCLKRTDLGGNPMPLLDQQDLLDAFAILTYNLQGVVNNGHLSNPTPAEAGNFIAGARSRDSVAAVISDLFTAVGAAEGPNQELASQAEIQHVEQVEQVEQQDITNIHVEPAAPTGTPHQNGTTIQYS